MPAISKEKKVLPSTAIFKMEIGSWLGNTRTCRHSRHMEWHKKSALKEHHQELRTGVIVTNVLPEFRQMLTDVEYSRIEDKTDNVSAVDELVKILLSKTDREFDGFCEILRENGYDHWARKLKETQRAHEQRGAGDATRMYSDDARAKPKPQPEPPMRNKSRVTGTPNSSEEQEWDEDDSGECYCSV